MTALKQYDRLECVGLWRDDPEAQRREVVVRFGEATLVLSDSKSEVPLSHWSLPAVERVNPGGLPALFRPGPDSDESLELQDDDMIAALETVRGAVIAATPRPGRLRGFAFGVVSVAILGVGLLWVPGALVSHTASVVPAAKRAELGQVALDDLTRLTGAPCDNQLGLRALAGLSERIFGPVDTPILYVVRDGLASAVHLPGDVIVLSSDLLEKAQGPEVLAGAALVEGLRAKTQDPMIALLNHSGLFATFQLLTSGNLSEASVAGYGEVALRAAPVALTNAAALSAFAGAKITSAPYALFIDPTGEATLPLIEGDPTRGTTPEAIMDDGDWIALQDICSQG